MALPAMANAPAHFGSIIAPVAVVNGRESLHVACRY
jgi:hypothetical protein